jgi:acetoacetyl-CoA synthetase
MADMLSRFYFTTCMWMMWHWHVSALSSGVTLVIYDGSPFYYRSNGRAVEDYLAMPKLIDELGINQFGTSAKFLSVLQQKAIKPKDEGVSLKTLKAVYSTGSPLAPATFLYVYQEFGPDIHLASISGGTDIIADFGTPCPLEPVHAGEIQVLGLGMAVQAWAQDGRDISSSGRPGELVCVKSFPSQPVSDAETAEMNYYMLTAFQVQFWGPSGQQKYENAYFMRFPGQWHHGDFIRFNPDTGGIYMLGRSDGTLNPSGVRFGSAEIYNLLLSHFAALIDDSLCVGRRREHETDETVVLFIKMKVDLELSSQLIGQIKKMVWDQLSPRHVPRLVVECPEIPYTHNSKKVEIAVKQIVSGFDTKTTASVANPHCLSWYREWATRN